MATSKKPAKAWADLTPAYRARLETGFRKGTFGQGYTSAGRAYAAGASRQVARGQASSKPGKLSEAERTKRRNKVKKAKAWSDRHANDPSNKYAPPTGLTPEEKATYTDRYLAAMLELEKGWKPVAKRKPIDWGVVSEFYLDYDVKDFDKDKVISA
jgi:hypothetical protein